MADQRITLPSELSEDRTNTGALEDYYVAINDIVLKIPPENISIYKESINHELATLRSLYTQQIKSGYGNVVVSINMRFVGNDDINKKLKPLIAGLRATPFCVCYSPYLQGSLRGIEEMANVDNKEYFFYRPLALALKSLTVSTVPGAPDSVGMNAEFIWFNYFPYMKEWVYKTGELPFERGTVFQSQLWKEFYQPYMQGSNIDWPHKDDDEPAAQIFFREYLTNPAFDEKANAAAQDLLQIIQKNPQPAFELLNKFLKDQDVQWTDQNMWDLFWKKVGKDSLSQGKDVSAEMRRRFQESQIQDGAITSALEYAGVGKFLRIAAQNAYDIDTAPKNIFIGADQNEIDRAIRELTKRNQEIRSFQANQPTTSATGEYSEYVPLPELTVTHDYKNSSGGVSHTAHVFGRKHRMNLSSESGIVIEGLSVTLRYNLALVPMMAYRYPTIQFTGGVKISANIMMNCTNKGAAKLNTVYDMIESIAHRYRLVPQGYQNLWIKNDLLNFLGLKEFLTQRIITETMDGQPGRSRVVLELSHAPVLSTTELDPPEVLNQEAIWTTEGIYLAIAHRLHDFTVRKIQREQMSDKDYKAYYLEPKIDKNDPKKKAIGTLVEEYCEAFNDAYRQAVNTIFKEPYVGKNMNRDLIAAGGGDSRAHVNRDYEKEYNERAKAGRQLIEFRKLMGVSSDFQIQNFAFLMGISEQSSPFGVMPNIVALQSGIVDLENAKKNKGQSSLLPGNEGNIQNNTSVARSLQHSAQLRKLGIKDTATEELAKTIRDDFQLFKSLFNFLDTYKAELKALADKIQSSYLDLPEFREINRAIHAADIQKGSMAYKDFKPQLDNTVSFLRRVYASASGDLTLYNPDLYLYNRAIDGPLVNIEDMGVLNPQTFARAKKISMDSHKNATRQAENWFQDGYFSTLNSAANQEPVKWLKKHVDDDAKDRKQTSGGKYYRHSLYSKQDFNNTLAEERPVTKKLTVDHGPHAHVNRFAAGTEMRGLNSVQHSTDFEKMWVGAETGAPVPLGAETDVAQSNTDSRVRLPPPPAGSKMERMTTFLKDFGVACEIVGLGNRWGGKFKTAPTGEEWMKHDWSDLGIPGWDPMHVDMGLKLSQEDRKYRYKTKSRSLDSLQPKFRKKATAIIRMLQKGEVGSKTKWKPWVVSAYRSSSKTSKDSKHKYGLAVDLGVELNGNKEHSTAVLRQYRREIDAKQRRQKVVDSNKVQQVRKNVTSTVTAPLEFAYREFENDLYTGQALGLVRAYPAFKLYFIEDDQGERRLGFDDFFNYAAVQSIRIVRDRHIAADLCELYVTNLSGVLSNRRFKQERHPEQGRDAQGKQATETKDPSKAGTRDENPIASMMLQEGTHFSVYLGYSNNKENLELVFTGVITELEFSGSEEIVRILGQSYGIELIQDIKGYTKPDTTWNKGWGGFDFWGLKGDAFTGELLEEMITQPEVLHFGRWTAVRKYETPNRALLTDKWQPKPRPQDDNIFPPAPKEELRDFADGIFFQSLRYTIYQTTIWDVFQEMTLRHPNYIAMAVPYREIGTDRMTMFFGLPNQLYFARDPSLKESTAASAMRREQEELEAKLETVKAGHIPYEYSWGKRAYRWLWEVVLPESLEEIILGGMDEARAKLEQPIKDAANEVKKMQNNRLEYGKKMGFIRPFRKYHLLTSSYHIVNNNIQANARDVANTVVVRYNKDLPDDDEIIEGVNTREIALSNADEEITVKLDAALPDEEVRTQVASFLNVSNPNLARRYALGLLLRNTKNTYKGEVVILGNPKIKPHDVCYLFDEYNDMIGPIEVDRVTHVFTPDQGFLTEIKPSMLAQVGEWSLLHSCTAMGVVMEGAVKDLFGSGPKGTGTQIAQAGLSLMAPVAGALFDYFGGFMSEAILNYTQFGFPLVLSPLNHRGRVFAGGIPTHKLPKSMWKCIFGDWSPMARDGFNMWLEDKIDEIMSTLKTVTFQNTQGQFWHNANTLDVR